jgi:hypothetical protein
VWPFEQMCIPNTGILLKVFYQSSAAGPTQRYCSATHYSLLRHPAIEVCLTELGRHPALHGVGHRGWTGKNHVAGAMDVRTERLVWVASGRKNSGPPV